MDQLHKALELVENRNRACRRYYRRKMNPFACPVDENSVPPDPAKALKYLEKHKADAATAKQRRHDRGLLPRVRQTPPTQALLEELARMHLLDNMSQEQITALLTRPAQSAEDPFLEDHGLVPGQEMGSPGTPLEAPTSQTYRRFLL